MKIVLLSSVQPLGRKGDICEVADGYAQNYLIPKGLAVKANKGSIAEASAMKRARELQDRRRLEEAREMSERLTGKNIVISARASEAGRLFGSVNASALAAAVEEQTKVALPVSVFELAEPIKELGVHTVRARLHEEVSVDVSVEVTASDATSS